MSKTTLIGVAVTLLSISAVAQSNVDMRTIVQDKLMDLSADVAQQTANRRELERISRDYSERFPYHEDFKFVLVTTAACVKEADARRVDVTSLVNKINLGE